MFGHGLYWERMLNDAKSSIMVTMFFSMGQGENHYTVTSMDKLLLNLEKFHDIKIGRRWTFQCTRDMEDAGYIRRHTRYRHNDEGLIAQIPSMFTFTLKGVAWLAKKGVKGARKLHRSMMHYLKKNDKRFPARVDFEGGDCKPEDPEGLKRFNDLLAGIGKPIGQN